MKDAWRDIERALAEQQAEAAREAAQQRRILDPKRKRKRKR